ncbi:MAG: type II toxin-antitoxin system VapC family toxin [Cyclobacteriaceae bacterium]|nr:type II toxin-antitoxin system VapC family toxin [Cyclobacteriaceae bacterium]UYN85697.1 MAG: type II toxin-antitoxin system VapC family toxin [Cyclobacteriaceae bacterium]
MEQKYLIDTNVFIDYLAAKLPVESLNFIDQVLDVQFYISIINKIELLGFKNITPKEEKIFKVIVDSASIIHLDELIANKTIELRKKYAIKLPDSIIAASAISYGCKLLTSNHTDFSKIAGLKIINPANPGKALS